MHSSVGQSLSQFKRFNCFKILPMDIVIIYKILLLWRRWWIVKHLTKVYSKLVTALHSSCQFCSPLINACPTIIHFKEITRMVISMLNHTLSRKRFSPEVLLNSASWSSSFSSKRIKKSEEMSNEPSDFIVSHQISYMMKTNCANFVLLLPKVQIEVNWQESNLGFKPYKQL